MEMKNNKRPRRQRKADRLLSPDAHKDEIACDYAIAPMDRLATQMDEKWGIDQLPTLVSVETAQKYGIAMAHLNACILETEPTKCADAANNVIRGLHAMDAEATAAGHQPASGEFWEYELPPMDGRPEIRVAVARDITEWQTIKKRRPDLVVYSMREVALALDFYQRNGLLQEVKKNFPSAQVTKIKPQKTKPPVDYANGGDPIEF